MKFLKNRLAVGISCIVMSLLIGLVGIPLMTSSRNEKIDVVRLKTDIVKGQQLKEEMLEKVLVDRASLPQGIARDRKDVAGLYAAYDMVSGEYIFSKKVSSEPAWKNEYLYTLPQDKMAVSVTIRSFAAGLSGKLLPQDIVTLFSVEEASGIQGQVSVGRLAADIRSLVYPELQYVEVLSVTTASGNDMEKREIAEDSKKEGEASSSLPVAVTLLVNRKQAERLTVLEKKGGIHIGLVSRGNEDLRKKLLDIQEKLFLMSKESQNNTASTEEKQ